MGKNNFRFFGVFALLISILILGFVLAASNAPTALTFEQNTTPNYDKEGNFTVNWTAGGGGDPVFNYTISIYAGDVLYTSAKNDSDTGYSFSNTTDANYTFKIDAINATGWGTSSATNISMIVDTTIPDIVYNPTTETDNTGADRTWIFVNVTITETNNDTVTFYLYNSTGTIPAGLVYSNSSNYNLSEPVTINWTGLAEGIYYFNVVANDSANNSGESSDITFYLDGTDPTSVTLTESSSTTSSLTLTISASDALSGFAASSCTAVGSGTKSISGTGESQTLTVTGLSCGRTYQYTVTCSDRASNSKSSSDSFSTDACGGGTPSVSEWAKQKIHSWTKITPGVVTIMKDFDREIGIKQIQIEVSNEAQNVKITVKKYDSKPAEVSVTKTGKVQKYLQIDAPNLEGKLDKATLTIQVDKSWVSDNALVKDDVALFKFDESAAQWNELTTTYTEDDDTYYYYNVELTSFSYFAIGQSVVAEEEEAVAAAAAAEEARNLTWLWILIAIIVLVVIIGGGIALKKKGQ